MSLVASHIVFRYGAVPILDGVSVTLAPGDVVGVLGPNGAGKSTLARIALGLLTPQSGTVTIDGSAMATLPIRDRARRVAAVLQGEHTEFAFTVRELAMFARHAVRRGFTAPSPADHAAVDAALVAADALAFADRPLAALSGGERQRALLARALAQQTSYLVLDEPTAFMDLRHQQGLAALVRSLASSHHVGIVWILHDPDLALRYCTHALVLAAGRVAAFGPPATVLTPELLAAVFAVRSERTRDTSGAEHLLVTGTDLSRSG